MSLDGKIVYIPMRDYDIVISSNGVLEDYNYNQYNAKTLGRKFGE